MAEDSPAATGGFVKLEVLGERREDGTYPIAIQFHPGYTHRQVVKLLGQACIAMMEYAKEQEASDGER